MGNIEAELTETVDKANKLMVEFTSEIDEVRSYVKLLESKRQALDTGLAKMAEKETSIKSREAELLKAGETNAILVRTQEVRRELIDLRSDIQAQTLVLKNAEARSKDALEKLAREIFDFNELKRVHGNVRKEFETYKNDWVEKIELLKRGT